MRNTFELSRLRFEQAGTPKLAWAALLSCTILAWTGTASAAPLQGSFQGGAFGIDLGAAADPLGADLDRVGGMGASCRGTSGATTATTVQSFSAGTDGSLLTAGQVRSTVTSDKTAAAAEIRTSSTISGLNLFDGLITADAVRAVANGHATAGDFAGSFDESGFTNLRIAGKRVAGVQLNAEVPLPGIGSVELKHVAQRDRAGNKGNAAITMILVKATESNPFDLPVGAELAIGHAAVGYTPIQLNVPARGQAYASRGSLSGQAAQYGSETGRIKLGCEGTGGETIVKDTPAVTGGHIFSIGAARTTVLAGDKGTGTIVKTTASASGINLLSGLVKAVSAKAIAQNTVTGGKRTSSTAGSGVIGLKIAGLSLGDVTKANAKFAVPGVGYIIANEQNASPGPTEPTFVSALHLHVTQSNLLGLNPGSDLIISHANSFARP